MLRAHSLRFAYDEKSGFSFPDIQLEQGEQQLILGESGVGKTTLLHLLAGILVPHSGSVELLGTKVHELTPNQRDRFRGRNIGLVFQQPRFIQDLNALEHLELVRYLAGKGVDSNRISEVLEALGMQEKRYDKPGNLSQGEQQRVAIAMAVVNRPSLILADEPTSSLDDTNCAKVVGLLKNQALETGAQLLIITHDFRLREHFPRILQL